MRVRSRYRLSYREHEKEEAMTITSLTSGIDGLVYLHTHKGRDGAEIAEALRPYIGHLASFYPPNDYGHVNPHSATRGYLRAIDGTQVHVYVPRTGYEGPVDAFDAFGSYCTHIHPKREGE